MGEMDPFPRPSTSGSSGGTIPSSDGGLPPLPFPTNPLEDMGQQLSSSTSSHLLSLQSQLEALVVDEDGDIEDEEFYAAMDHDRPSTYSVRSRTADGKRRRMSLDMISPAAKSPAVVRPQSMFLRDHSQLVFPPPPRPRSKSHSTNSSTSTTHDDPDRFPSKLRPRSPKTEPPTSSFAFHSNAFPTNSLQLDLSTLPAPIPTSTTSARRRSSSGTIGSTGTRRIPLLPTIPSSPNPPISPRSSSLVSPFSQVGTESDAPTLPPVSAVSPLYAPDLCLTPPTASLMPTSTSWPTALYSLNAATSSTPELSQAVKVTATDAEGPVAVRSTSDQGRLETVKFETTMTAFEDNSPVEVNPQEGDGRKEKCYHALLELVETESAYLDSLRVLVKVYFHTLPFLTVLSSEQVSAVIRNSEALQELHERLVRRLALVEKELDWQQREEGGSDEHDAKVLQAASDIARVFSDELPNFTLYQDFCARHREAFDIIRAIEAKPEWEAFERNCASTASSSFASPPEKTPVATPSTINAPHFFPPLQATPSTSSTATSRAPTAASKLRFQDYAINPIQRICRYPMILGQVVKNLPVDSVEGDQVQQTKEGMRQVAQGVDEAKRVREGELRTNVISHRMEFKSPVNMAFCDVLGPSRLIGSLHVLHRFPSPDALRSKYYGCFLYRSHLVMVKVKKRDSYEPRQWLPLRQFEIVDVPDEDGFLPHSIRLTYKDHHFELGATGPQEKAIWLAHLRMTYSEATQAWFEQPLDEFDQPTLFDDTLVSSVYPKAVPSPSSPSFPLPSKWPHRRADSASSLPGAFDRLSTFYDEPTSYAPSYPSLPTPTHHASRSFSKTTTALLGRTPAAQRATIDLRLSDIFSEELLAARMLQATRDAPSRSASRPGRTRTTSGGGALKRAPQSLGRLSLKERRRMSLIEPGELGNSEFRGPIGFDSAQSEIYRDEIVERKWTSALKKSKSSAGQSRTRPVLPEIDTSFGPSGSSSKSPGSWKSRAMSLRRVASHSSLDRAYPGNTSPALPSAEAADIERNNSVSSTNSSSCAGSGSTSSHYTQEIDTPASSLPPSPDLRSHDTPLGASHKSFGSTSSTNSFIEGASNAFRLKRRRSQLALVVDGLTPPLEGESAPTSPVEAKTDLSRRSSTLGGYFQKRVASSPTLSTLFSTSNSQAMGRLPSASTSNPTLYSASSPHLPLPTFSCTPPTTALSTPGTTPGTSPEMLSTRSLAPDFGGPSESGSSRRAKSLRFAFSRQFKLSPISPVNP